MDLDFIFSHNSFAKLSSRIQELPITNDIQISALQARLIAQLNLISSSEKVEFQIKEACSIVVDDTKSEAQKLYAVSFILLLLFFFRGIIWHFYNI